MASDIPDPDYSWRAHPARERPRDAAMAFLVMAGLGAAASFLAPELWGTSGAIAVAVMSVLALLAALHRFYFPSRFLIDGEGITARYLLASQRLRWTDLKRFVHDTRGGFLSTRSRPSWLDRYTGLHILFGDDSEPVIEQIRDHLSDKAAT